MTAIERKNFDRAKSSLWILMCIFIVGFIFERSAAHAQKTLNNTWLPFVISKNPEGQWPLCVGGLVSVALGCYLCVRLFKV